MLTTNSSTHCLFNLVFFFNDKACYFFQDQVKCSLTWGGLTVNPAKVTVIYQLSLLLSPDHLVEKLIILSYQSHHLLTVKWLLQGGGLSMSHAKSPKSLPTIKKRLTFFFFFFFSTFLSGPNASRRFYHVNLLYNRRLRNQKVCGNFWSPLASSLSKIILTSLNITDSYIYGLNVGEESIVAST